MRLAVFKFLSDLHQEYAAMLPGNQVLPLLGCLVGIALLQFFGGYEGNVFWQMLDGIRIFVPDLMLHVFDDLEYGAYSLF